MTQSYIPGGLGVTLGFAKESVVGTYVAPTRWIQQKTEGLELKKLTKQSEAVQGSRFRQASRRVLVGLEAGGPIEYELADKQFGLILAACIGSTVSAVQDASTTLYVQNHVPNFLEGQSLSFQKGVPENNGTTLVNFSYNGCKITEWTIACSEADVATLSLTVDAWNEVTTQSYTSATYLDGASSPNILNWASGSLLIGGTVSTTSGVTTISGNAAPTALVSSISIKGSNALATGRRNFGSLTKSEQLTNGFTDISGEVEIEFANLNDYYNAFSGDTNVVLEVTFLGGVTQAGGYQSGLGIIIPAIKLEGESPKQTDTGVIKCKVPFTGLQDTAGTDPAIQLQYTSTDAAV